MFFKYFDYMYPLVITIVFFLIYIYFSIKIKKEEEQKLLHIEKRHISDAVETQSPIEDQVTALKVIGIEGLENRFSLISKIFPILLLIIWALAVSLPYLGELPSVYITILAAIISVVAGVSLRPFLENLFSGIVISFFKSIKVGDTVIIDGHYGLIEKIGTTFSTLKRWDWNRIVIPNSKLLQKEIQNLTMNDEYIWAYIEFFVAPDCNLKTVEKISKKVAKSSKYFKSVEDPSFWVMDIQKDTIKCWLAAWANNPGHAWELRNELRTNLLFEFQQEGIKFHKIEVIIEDKAKIQQK